MKKPKNTQNADMPTKSTREYNYTPNNIKRHISKIFALVACLLLMVNISIPCFADSATTDPTVSDQYIYQATSYVPTTLEIDIFKASTGTAGRITQTLETSYQRPSASLTGELTYQTEHAMFLEGQYTYTVNKIFCYDPSATYDSRYQVTVPSSLSNGDNNWQRLSWRPFMYYADADIPFPAINFVYTGTSYQSYYVKYDFVDAYTGQKKEGMRQLDKFAPSTSYPVSLKTIFQDMGVDLTHDTYINCLELVPLHYVDEERTEEDLETAFSYFYVDYNAVPLDVDTYGDYMQTGKVIYKEVVNTRTYTDLLDFLGDAMENFLTTELFPIGNLSVTPMAILGVLVGLAITLLCIKFFAGG